MLVSDPGSRPARPARSRVLRLRGLPYRAVEDDILRFLAPLSVLRVDICRRNGKSISARKTYRKGFGRQIYNKQSAGRTTGEAYVQLASRLEAGKALRTKNRQHLGNRYIE